jgi:hypothetical protein
MNKLALIVISALSLSSAAAGRYRYGERRYGAF